MFTEKCFEKINSEQIRKNMTENRDENLSIDKVLKSCSGLLYYTIFSA